MYIQNMQMHLTWISCQHWLQASRV